MSNTIDWGKIHYNSWSPETNLTGSGGTPSYQNEYSFQFDGVDEYVDLATSTNLNFSGSFTLMAWIKTDAIGSYQMIIDTSTSATTGNGYSMYLQASGKIRFWSYHAGFSVDSLTTLSTSTWYHVACVHNATVNKIYIDGVLDNTNSYSNHTTSNTTNLRIGNSSVLAGTFDGMIDEVAFFGTDESTNINAIGSTIPTDLTTYSPTTWYRMGEEATFDGIRDWNLVDQGTGGNDAVTQNIADSERVTDVPT
jgi:hypothetical protein